MFTQELAGGGPRHRLFSAAQYHCESDEWRELSHDELDLVVTGELHALTQLFAQHRPVEVSAIKASCDKNGLCPCQRPHFTPYNAMKLSHI